MPLGCANFHLSWCNELPLRGENADFRPLSIFNTSSLLLRSNPASNNFGTFGTHSRHLSEAETFVTFGPKGAWSRMKSSCCTLIACLVFFTKSRKESSELDLKEVTVWSCCSSSADRQMSLMCYYSCMS